MKRYRFKTMLLLFFISCILYGTGCNNNTPIDYERDGVNTEHLFIFTDTTMTYNGIDFHPGMTIGELCSIFGRYNRQPEIGIYLWDSLGITMTSLDPEDLESNIVNGILIDWNIDIDFNSSNKTIQRLYERCPRKYFTGNIIVGDAVLGRGMQIKDFLSKTKMKYEFDNFPFPVLHFYDVDDWDYRKTDLRLEQYFTYCIIESEDHTNIETFNVAISRREQMGEYRKLQHTYHKDYPDKIQF